MPSLWVPAAIIVSTIVVAFLIRSVSSRFDAILLMFSGVASLILVLFATDAMHASVGEGIAFEISQTSFNIGILPPVFVVATLTAMRDLSKFIQE
ncbi:MAG: hypothetical protein ABWY13_16220 [Mesorhizobium sp.]|jgi:hypothetical protein